MMLDYFLKIDGIDGESRDRTHQGEVELESFSWGEVHSPSPGGGGGAGRVNIQDLHVEMRTSKASPPLMLAGASGEHLKSAVLTVRRAGQDHQEFLVFKLGDVMVSSYQTGAAAGQDSPVDQVSFSFSRIEMTYRPLRPDGSLDTPVNVGWDVKANHKV